MNKALLTCDNLCKTYQDGDHTTEVLKNVSFSLQPGELTAIVGSSGSGKSTLLHLLGGLDEPSSGEILFMGQSLTSMSLKQKAKLRNQSLGFIYQFHHLLPDFTALENIAMPLLISCISASEATEQANQILNELGLSHRASHRPAALSGGERQRVAIGRALINKPALVMADEPTGNLDQKTAASILELLVSLNQSHHITFLVVTHDLTLAQRLGNQ